MIHTLRETWSQETGNLSEEGIGRQESIILSSKFCVMSDHDRPHNSGNLTFDELLVLV
jgi:hypothetical protein